MSELDGSTIAAVIAGGAALSGVVVGGAFSYVATYFMEGVRWKREELRRSEKERRAVYSKLLRAVSQLTLLPEEERDINSEPIMELSSKFAEVEIIGSKPVVEATRKFSLLIHQQLFFPDDKRYSVDDWTESLQKLIEAIRNELSVD